MPQHAIEALQQGIEKFTTSEEEKIALRKEVSLLEKELLKFEFKILRTIKDKEIAINLLNTSMESLEQTNRMLSARNEEIGQKNEELNQQKQLLEDSGKELEVKLLELQQSYEALEQFSYIASHDLKTPLRSIAGYAQLLQRRYANQLDADAEEFIGYIVAGAKHMNDIICDLLEYSRTSIKNQGKKTVDLNQILKTVLQNMQAEIEANQAQVIVEPLPQVEGHESGLVQLFQNLIGNALKFKNEKPPVIKIYAENQHDIWFFTVKDNGIGIDENFSKKLFTPFQRLQTTKPGLGMGLAICRKIIQMHGGQIWYKPNPEGGAIFHFTIAASKHA